MLLVSPLSDSMVSCSSRFKSDPWKPCWACLHLLMPPFSYCLSRCLHMAFFWTLCLFFCLLCSVSCAPLVFFCLHVIALRVYPSNPLKKYNKKKGFVDFVFKLHCWKVSDIRCQGIYSQEIHICYQYRYKNQKIEDCYCTSFAFRLEYCTLPGVGKRFLPLRVRRGTLKLSKRQRWQTSI